VNAPANPHNDLAASLAAHLRRPGPNRRLTWENLTFNCAEDADAYSCRPDVFSIMPTLEPERCRPWTCEVKVSRADFLSDIRSEKWKRYRRFSCRIWFATPAGMIRPDELPEGLGLWEYGERWRQVVQPKFCKGWQLTGRDLMRLIMGKWGTYADMLPVPATPS
jgi:hypothetical protein